MSLDPGIVAGESLKFEASQGSYIVRPYFKKKKKYRTLNDYTKHPTWTALLHKCPLQLQDSFLNKKQKVKRRSEKGL